jgi:hypothetical protein
LHSAQTRPIQLVSVSHAFSRENLARNSTRVDKPGAAPPAQLDYSLVPLIAFFQEEQESTYRSSNARNERSQTSVWQAILQMQHCGGISWCAVHFGSDTQKPPTTASYGTQADAICTSRNFLFLSLVSRMFHNRVCQCAGHVPDTPGTNAIPPFRSHRKSAGTANPDHARSIDTGDTTRVCCSQKPDRAQKIRGIP